MVREHDHPGVGVRPTKQWIATVVAVHVIGFIVHPRDRMLGIGTHGRGVWAIDVSKIGGQ